jgi:hypothetical protein
MGFIARTIEEIDERFSDWKSRPVYLTLSHFSKER